VALLELLRSAKTFRGEGTLEHWADRVVARTALRMARDARTRTGRDATADSEDTMGAPPALADGPANAMDVEHYLQHLPEVRRSTLVLRHVLGYSVEEVASLTGVSPNTVKDRLVQALQEVRSRVRRDP
jgi:RNA polymerase sigma-70 factor (ECF subfamily)